ncbi:MAG: endolytic transglycosylase MltG [Patescibacteria group bacterium]
MSTGLQIKRSHIIAIAVAIMCLSVVMLGTWLPAQRKDNEIREIIIERGQNLQSIADDLKSQQLIRSKYLFIFYVTARGQESQLQAGRYHLTRSMNILQIAYRLVNGLAESDDLKVVITEGSNIWEIDEKIVEAGLAREGEFARLYYPREGKLFPDTYRFKKDTVLKEVGNKFADTYAKKSGNPNIYTLITASLLEKEAKKPEDMAMVADIIERRLGLGMLLQMDASVGYGWCLRTSLAQNFARRCDVTQAPIATEIRRDGEFNLYMRHGLPPRPISNPGTVAINAARNPIKNEYLFYLSTRDGSELIFAKTLQEHERNRRKYLGL